MNLKSMAVQLAVFAVAAAVGAYAGALAVLRYEPQCVVSSIRSDELPAHPEPDLTPFERELLGRPEGGKP